MNSNWNVVDLGWRSGSICTMTKEAIEHAELLNTKVSFEFNGIKVNVTKESDWEDVATKALNSVSCNGGAVFGKGWN